MKWSGVLALLMIALAGCATPAKPRYYTLSGDIAPASNTASISPEFRVAIGPVTLPEALDRPQIVLRIAPNRYAISDSDLWSESLKREIPRVLAQDAGQRLRAAQVAAYFQYGGQDADYRVLIDVRSFDAVPGVSATLDAAWSVRGRAGARLHEARSVLVERVNAAGIAALVSAQAKTLSALAREIAAAVNALARPRR